MSIASGRSAEKRMRTYWRDLVVFAVFGVALAAWVWLDDGWSQIVAAILLGALLATFAFGWMLGFDARSLRFVWGASGERWTAEELDRLESPPWQVFHDVTETYGNWDHIAVGPGGVFLIDSKNLSERAVVDDSGLRAGSLRVPGVRSRGAAFRLKEAIERESGQAVWVQSVVTVWGELDGGAAERDSVIYVPGAQLAETLLAQRERLSGEVIAEVARVVGRLQKVPVPNA